MSPILPSRPLRLSGGFVARNWIATILCWLAGLALFVLGIWWQGGEAAQFLHEKQLWATGEHTSNCEYKGERSSNHFIFFEWNLTVHYVDAAGGEHRAKKEWSSLFATIPAGDSPVVAYDPKHPDDFALSSTLELGGGRWASIVFFMVMFSGVFGLGLVWVGFLALRRLRDAGACAHRSDELELAVTSVVEQVVNGRRTGALVYHFEHASKKRQWIAGKNKPGPLFSSTARTHLVALRSQFAPDRPVVVRADGYPFAFKPEEIDAIAERIKARSATAA